MHNKHNYSNTTQHNTTMTMMMIKLVPAALLILLAVGGNVHADHHQRGAAHQQAAMSTVTRRLGTGDMGSSKKGKGMGMGMMMMMMGSSKKKGASNIFSMKGKHKDKSKGKGAGNSTDDDALEPKASSKKGMMMGKLSKKSKEGGSSKGDSPKKKTKGSLKEGEAPGKGKGKGGMMSKKLMAMDKMAGKGKGKGKGVVGSDHDVEPPNPFGNFTNSPAEVVGGGPIVRTTRLQRTTRQVGPSLELTSSVEVIDIPRTPRQVAGDCVLDDAGFYGEPTTDLVIVQYLYQATIPFGTPLITLNTQIAPDLDLGLAEGILPDFFQCSRRRNLQISGITGISARGEDVPLVGGRK